MSAWSADPTVEGVSDVEAELVYAAESRVVLKPHQSFTEFDSCKALVDAITESPYWYARGGDAAMIEPVHCFRQRSNSASRGGHYHAGWAIRLNRQHWNVQIICHELAHVMAFWRHDLPKGHTRPFRTEYLSLLRYVAPDLAAQLVKEFDADGLGVDHDPTGWDAAPFDFVIAERIAGAIAL